MSKTDAVSDIAEMIKAWNTIEAQVRASYPGASAEKVYRITAAAMTKALAAWTKALAA